MLYSPLRDSSFEYRLRRLALILAVGAHSMGLFYTFIKKPAITQINLSLHTMGKNYAQKIYVRSGYKINATPAQSVASTKTALPKGQQKQLAASKQVAKHGVVLKKQKKKALVKKEKVQKKNQELKKIAAEKKQEVKPEPVKIEEVKKVPEKIEPEKKTEAPQVIEQQVTQSAAEITTPTETTQVSPTLEIPLEGVQGPGFVGQEEFVAQLRAAIPRGFYDYGILRIVCKLDSITGKATEFSQRTTEPLALYMAVKQVISHMLFPRQFWGTHLELAIRI